MAASAPLPGAGGAAVEPAQGAPELEHALRGAGLGAHWLCANLGIDGPAPCDLDEQRHPLRVAPGPEGAGGRAAEGFELPE